MKTIYTFITVSLFCLSYSGLVAQGTEGTSVSSNYEIDRMEDLKKASNSATTLADETPGAILKGGPADANFINFQAVARDANGDLMTNATVAIEFNIHEATPNGTTVYSENQNLTTDDNGVFSAQIGSVSALDVSWNESSYFLEVLLNGTSVGTTQFVSVPYAMSAATMPSNALIGDSTTNHADVLTISGGNGPLNEIVDIQATQPLNLANDILNLEMPAGSSESAQFIEARMGGVLSFQVNGDGRTLINTTTTAPSLNTVYGNSMPIAYGSVALGFNDIQTGYGIISITNPNTGEYDIVLDHNTDASNCIVVLTPYTGAFGSPEIMGYEPTGANTFKVRIQTPAGVAKDSAFTFVVFGNH